MKNNMEAVCLKAGRPACGLLEAGINLLIVVMEMTPSVWNIKAFKCPIIKIELVLGYYIPRE